MGQALFAILLIELATAVKVLLPYLDEEDVSAMQVVSRMGLDDLLRARGHILTAIMTAGLLLIFLVSPASAKVYILQWGKTYEVWETRGLWSYPIQGRIPTEREAREIARKVRGK